jgi:hypothetical protein
LQLFEKLFTRNCLIEIFKNCKKQIREDNELLVLNFVFSEFYNIYKDLKKEEDLNKQNLNNYEYMREINYGRN